MPRPKGSKNKRKFSASIELRAEKKMASFLDDSDKNISMQAAKFILEHNRGKAKQQTEISGDTENPLQLQIIYKK